MADAVVAHPAARWWRSPAQLDAQCQVTWLDETPSDPLASVGIAVGSTVGAGEKLARWRRSTLSDEVDARARPTDPSAPWSGQWWSTPALVSLLTSARSLEMFGPVGLTLVEDALGWAEARVTPVSIAPDARIYEIDSPDAVTALVDKYPIDVSLSRRHDWWNATGEAGSWIIPDWQAVATDFDGVHLTVLGYLSSAGRALAVEPQASGVRKGMLTGGGSGDAGSTGGLSVKTVLAGWDPDRTYWLTDVVRESHRPHDWHLIDSQPARWVEAGATWKWNR